MSKGVITTVLSLHSTQTFVLCYIWKNYLDCMSLKPRFPVKFDMVGIDLKISVFVREGNWNVYKSIATVIILCRNISLVLFLDIIHRPYIFQTQSSVYIRYCGHRNIIFDLDIILFSKCKNSVLCLLIFSCYLDSFITSDKLVRLYINTMCCCHCYFVITLHRGRQIIFAFWSGKKL